MKIINLCVLCVFCFGVFSIQAQCVVDTTNFEMITPPSEELPCVERGVPYQAVIQFFTPPSLGGVSIDSIKVTTFNGLPTGIQTLCTPAICTMVGLGRACIIIEGTTNDTTGIYSIDYDGFAYTTAGTASFDYLRANFGMLPNYDLIVINPGDACANTPNGINQLSVTTSDFSVWPNPSNGRFQLQLINRRNLFTGLTVRDITGRIVQQMRLTVGASAIELNLGNEAKGVYVIQLSSEEGSVSKRIIVE